MEEIKNTIIMVIEPQPVFFEWIEELIEKLKKSPSSLQASYPDFEKITTPTVVYIPNMDFSNEKITEYLVRHCEELLIYEYSKWTRDENLWPLRCDLEFFLDMFKLSFYDNIVDVKDLK